jgi:sulfite reductase (NADPH) flavoprotein alpha-component
MAPDVDAAIHAVVEEHGGRSKEAAAEYVANLRTQKRYRRDVY